MSEEVFHNIIYKVNGAFWQDHICGTGSLLEHTVNVREHLPIIIETFEVTSMLDAPCGDFSWMSQVMFPSGFKYIGGDIVSKLINEISETYPNFQFIHCDVVNNELPEVDMLFCRDLLIHLPSTDIIKLIKNAANSNIKYFTASTYHNDHNNDIDVGQCRSVNLQAAPFNLPEPLYMFDDGCRDVVRSMGVWSQEQLIEAIENWAS